MYMDPSGDASVQKELRQPRRQPIRSASKKLKRSVSRTSTSTSTSKNNEKLYEVEDIVGEKMLRGRKFFKVRWQGFTPEDDSWEPAVNLKGVRDLIDAFRRRKKMKLEEAKRASLSTDSIVLKSASPASVPTSPSTSHPSLKPMVQRQRGGSEEPNINGPKHERQSRNRGRYEYVPKNELVACKTKYFDDIQNGLVDLVQYDLYSRVKIRKRLTDASSDSQTSLVSAAADTSINTAGDLIPPISCNQNLHNAPIRDTASINESTHNEQPTCSLKSDPHSLSSENFNTVSSMSGFTSLRDSMLVDQPKSMFTIGHSSISQLVPSVSAPDFEVSEEPRSKTPITKPTTCDQSIQCDLFQHAQPAPSSPTPPVQKKAFVDVALSPLPDAISVASNPARRISPIFPLPIDADLQEMFTQPGTSAQPVPVHRPSPFTVRDCPPFSRPRTVHSIRELVKIYFKLISQLEMSTSRGVPSAGQGGYKFPRDVSRLNDLPTLETHSISSEIRTKESLFRAILHEQWNYLATLPTGKTSKRDVDGPVLSDCEGQSEPTWAHFFRQASNATQGSVDLRSLWKTAILDTCGRPVVLDQMIHHGLDPNIVLDGNGETPLSLSVKFGRLHTVRALLEYGAKPDPITPGYQNLTLLGKVVTEGNYDMVLLLLHYGANFYEVEPNTTALQLIQRQLKSFTEATGPPRHPTVYTNDIRSFLYPSPPPLLPEPPPGIELSRLPQNTLINAYLTINSSKPSCPSQPSSSASVLTGRSAEDSVDLLKKWQKIHDLIQSHHVHLSNKIGQVLKIWLFRAGLEQVASVASFKWISVRNRSASISFSWPPPLGCLPEADPDRSMCPILLLIHGRFTPPCYYDMWMDDEGPCLIERVILDQTEEQKALGRVPFVTTLYPLYGCSQAPRNHKVNIEFSQLDRPTNRSTCIAISIIAARLLPPAPEVQSASGPKVPRISNFRSPSHPKKSVTSPNQYRCSYH